MQRYLKGQMDLHQKLLLKDTEKFSAEDKIFVLNNYFDLNYKNMVLKRPYFTELYNRRANAKELNLDMFTPQEYSDIMANYTLCWIDEIFKKDILPFIMFSSEEGGQQEYHCHEYIQQLHLQFPYQLQN